jgi:hypothetical protein
MLAVRGLRGCSLKNRLNRPVELGDDGNGIQALETEHWDLPMPDV